MIIDSKARKDIEIGRIGENEARKIWFHIGNILSDFPGASFTLMHKRPGDIAAYPVNSSYIEIEDNSLYWTVQSGDLTTEGIGYCELEATKDGAVVKTEIFRTKILPALDDSEDPPEPWESWVEQVAEDAEDAADSAEDAEAWAVGQRGGEDVGSSDPTYHNNAKYWSDQAEETLSSKADKVNSATSGNFAGLDSNGNLTDSGSKASDFLTEHQDISGKADKVAGGTENNFAGLDSNGNLKDSGSKASDFLTSHQDISGKADKVSSAVSGNFAGLDENGNLTDSGHKHSDYLTAHQDITGKADKVSGAVSGNFAGLDGNGNLTDSGHKHSDYITSHQDISGKADKVASAVSGNFAGLDGNGNLTDSGSKASDFLTEHQDISGKLDKTDFYATEMPMGSSDSTKVSAAIGDLKSQINGMTVEETLLRDELPGTTTTVTLDSNGNPTSIVHSASGTTVRTDAFVWSTGSVTETRTASNKYITITTNLTTLAQTISAVQEVA